MWVIPNSNPEGQAFIAVLIIFLVFAFIAFCLRLYSRRLKKAALDASDWFCFLSLVTVNCSVTCQYLC